MPATPLQSLHRLNLVDLDRSGNPVTLVRVHDLVQWATWAVRVGRAAAVEQSSRVHDAVKGAVGGVLGGSC